MKIAYIGSPRLARPGQAADFDKKAIEGGWMPSARS